MIIKQIQLDNGDIINIGDEVVIETYHGQSLSKIIDYNGIVCIESHVQYGKNISLTKFLENSMNNIKLTK